MDRAIMARDNFLKGYNCSQAVVLAFSDLTGIDENSLLKLSSSFGGGMGRMREVCGTLCGAFIVLGLLYGYDDPKAFDEKNTHYKRVQQIAKEFEKEHGSIICRELLGAMGRDSTPVSEKRTEEYYKKRPCPDFCYFTAKALEKYIEEHPINGE